MAVSIDNLIKVEFVRGDINLLNSGLMIGGSGKHKPYMPLGGYTEYFVSDGIGGFEQANDSAGDPLFVRE